MSETCAVLPVYEHGAPARAVVAGLRSLGLTCVLVDDGSGPETARALDALSRSDPEVRLLRLPENSGKGAAVKAGLRLAADRGFTHALQIDADGQHALEDVPRFLEASRAAPDAVICGLTRFGPETPRSRLHGRRITSFWTRIHTLSGDIPDPMCGFRIYPLAPALALMADTQLGDRMDFDIEILVRLHWRRVPMRWIATAVRYPPGGISGFRMFFDNVLITRVHTVLFFGMLARMPALLARRRVPRG